MLFLVEVEVGDVLVVEVVDSAQSVVQGVVLVVGGVVVGLTKQALTHGNKNNIGNNV